MTRLAYLLQRLRRLAVRVCNAWRRYNLQIRIAQMDTVLARPDLHDVADTCTQALWAAQRAALRCELAALDRAR